MPVVPRIAPNLARFLPGLGQCIYGHSAGQIWVHQYINSGRHLHDILLPREAEIAVAFGDADLGHGVTVLSATARRRDPAAWPGRLYGSPPSPTIPQDLRAILHYLWNNRDEGEMLVWMRDMATVSA